jgi:hypothetical protein
LESWISSRELETEPPGLSFDIMDIPFRSGAAIFDLPVSGVLLDKIVAFRIGLAAIEVFVSFGDQIPPSLDGIVYSIIGSTLFLLLFL